MAATVTKLETRRRATGKVGGPTVRVAIDAFLDIPKIKGNPNTLRAYTNLLDRVAAQLDHIAAAEIGDALTELWGEAKPATWNRNRAAVGTWLAWCADKKNWATPALSAVVERQRENNDDTKAVSRSRIDRLCRRRDVPLREKTLWRMLYESASRASAVLALNIEDLDLPNKQAKITAKGGDIMWITCGTGTAHLLPRLIAGRERGPLFLSEYRPGPTAKRPPTRTTSAPKPAASASATTAPASCSPTTATGYGCTNSATPRPPTSARPTSPPTSSWPKPAQRPAISAALRQTRPRRRP